MGLQGFEMKSFDEWFKEEKERYPLKLDSVSCRKGYKAGQQSRQAEIDELKWMLKNSNGQADEFCKKSNELQKRIDEAVKCMEQNKPSFPMDFKHAIDALSILKGKQDD